MAVGMISNQKGVSLFEVLLALLLVSGSAVGLVKLHTYIEMKSDRAQRSIEALYLAESELEQFTTHGSTVKGGRYLFDDIEQDACYSQTQCQPLSADYFQTRCEARSSLQNGIEVKHITVEVCWFDRHGKQQSIELMTSVSKFNEFSI